MPGTAQARYAARLRWPTDSARLASAVPQVPARRLHGVLRGAGVRRLLSGGHARPDPPLARRGLSLETERRGPLRAASAVRPRERPGGSRQAGARGEIVLAGP